MPRLHRNPTRRHVLAGSARPNPNAATLVDHLKASHTLAEHVGRIAGGGADQEARSEPRRARRRPLDHGRGLSAAVRTTFNGPIVVGRDLLEVPLA